MALSILALTVFFLCQLSPSQSQSCDVAGAYIDKCVSPASECFECLPCWNKGDGFISPKTRTIQSCPQSPTSPSSCTKCVAQCNKHVAQSNCPAAEIANRNLQSSNRFTLVLNQSEVKTLTCSNDSSIVMLWAMYHESNFNNDQPHNLGQNCNKNILGSVASVCNGNSTCDFRFVFDSTCRMSAYVFYYGYYCSPYSSGIFPQLATIATASSPSSNGFTVSWWVFLIVFVAAAPIWYLALTICRCTGVSDRLSKRCKLCRMCSWRVTNNIDSDDLSYVMDQEGQSRFDHEAHARRGGGTTGVSMSFHPVHDRGVSHGLIPGINHKNKPSRHKKEVHRTRFENGIDFGPSKELDDIPSQAVYDGTSIPKSEESSTELQQRGGGGVFSQWDPHAGYASVPHNTQSIRHNPNNVVAPWSEFNDSRFNPGHGTGGGLGFASPTESAPEMDEGNEFGDVVLIKKSELIIIGEIGRGSFGRVYRARFRDQTVAAKKFRRDDVDEKKVQDFIKHEIKLSGQASAGGGHANVLKVVGYCEDPFCLVTECMDTSVRLYLDTERRENITSRTRADIALQAARGVKHLHELNIIHRDIAARNILMSHTPEGLRVVVSDFGMSKIMTQESYAQTYSAVGPLKWMAPEAIKEQKFSMKSDVYAFGITLWEIFTGEMPYADIDAVNTAVEVLVRQRRPELYSHIPQGLCELMQHCWKNEADERPEFDEVIQRLETFVEEFD